MLVKSSAANFLKTTLYQVISVIPGRIRWRIPGLLKNLAFQHLLKKFVASLDGVTNVRINPYAESIIVNFLEKKLSSREIQEKLAEVITKNLSVEHLSSNLVKEKKPNILLTEPSSVVNQSNPKITSLASVQDNIPSELLGDKLISSTPDSWLHQCQKQAKIIEQLEQQLAQLLSMAAIGSNLLNKWHFYDVKSNKSPNPSEPQPNWLSFEILQNQENWQYLAQQQAQKITQLQQQVREQQQLSEIAEFHLNKWRHRFYR